MDIDLFCQQKLVKFEAKDCTYRTRLEAPMNQNALGGDLRTPLREGKITLSCSRPLVPLALDLGVLLEHFLERGDGPVGQCHNGLAIPSGHMTSK